MKLPNNKYSKKPRRNKKLNYTIDRLCDNLSNLCLEEKKIIWNNYLDEVRENIDRIKRETEHKIAVREAAIQSVLDMTLVVNVVGACF